MDPAPAALPPTMMPIGGCSFDEGGGCIIRGNVGPESANVAKDAAARCAMSNILTEQPILRAVRPNSTQATWLTPLF